MLWAYNDDGYLISADVPESGTCRRCGAEYSRAIQEAKPWQDDVPDRCPCCGHAGKSVRGIRFDNRLVRPGDKARAGLDAARESV